MNIEFEYRGYAGTPYGHVPGHAYHDVDGTLSHTSCGWRCELLETWGCAQGEDEEHGRRLASGRSENPIETVERAKEEALACDMKRDYVVATCAKLMRAVEDNEERNDDTSVQS